MRKFSSYYIDDVSLFTKKLLSWSRNYKEICILDSNNYRNILTSDHTYHDYDVIAGIGSLKTFSPQHGKLLPALERFVSDSDDWIFGHLGYDLKNETEALSSVHPDYIKFPPVNFFIPVYIFLLRDKTLSVGWETYCNNEFEIEAMVREIQNSPPPCTMDINIEKITKRISRPFYLESVEKIKSHIQRGDIYEINFCQEFFSEKSFIDPPLTWIRLTEESPTPFSCYYRVQDKYLLCASPERFLKKAGNRIISQPIKGTAKRGRTPEEDLLMAGSLATDPKERAENIMITDLVRNDLSKIATDASVRVDELCAVYPFPHVYQMQSSVSATLPSKIMFTDIIRSAFPMGSMTGAPKIRAMEIIEQYEKSRRGLFSGSVGYITPEKDFDFNVVIRSIQYNQTDSFLSFIVGGAITSLSVPEKEYNECLLKAEAIMKTLNQNM